MTAGDWLIVRRWRIHSRVSRLWSLVVFVCVCSLCRCICLSLICARCRFWFIRRYATRSVVRFTSTISPEQNEPIGMPPLPAASGRTLATRNDWIRDACSDESAETTKTYANRIASKDSPVSCYSDAQTEDVCERSSNVLTPRGIG